MLRLARRYVSNQAIAEALVQETWVVLLRGIDGFQGGCRLVTWLMGILLSTARKGCVREHSPYVETLWSSHHSDLDLDDLVPT